MEGSLITGAELPAWVIPTLLGAQIGTQVHQGHVAARQGRKQARDARAERLRVQRKEKAKAALLKQGVQEQATELATQNALSDSGGVPLSVKKRLTIGGSGANV